MAPGEISQMKIGIDSCRMKVNISIIEHLTNINMIFFSANWFFDEVKGEIPLCGNSSGAG